MPSRTKFVITALLIAMSAIAQAQTPARKTFDLWLQAFNSDNRTALAAFWDTHNPAWKGIDRELVVSRESGGFTLMKVITDDGSHLEAVVADAGETFLGVTVKMNPLSSAAPVDRIDIHGVPRQDDLIPHYANDQELIQAVEAKVDGLSKSDKFAGAVMITRHGKVLLREARGEADRQSRKKITMNTQFGSSNSGHPQIYSKSGKCFRWSTIQFLRFLHGAYLTPSWGEDEVGRAGGLRHLTRPHDPEDHQLLQSCRSKLPLLLQPLTVRCRQADLSVPIA